MTDQDWATLYADYLRSAEWAARRDKVMERASHRCEGCRERLATDVHHLTYEHVTQEFLFELVALCAECHDRIHGQPMRPRAPTWTPRHTGRAVPTADTPGARARRSKLAELAEKHRARTMADRDGRAA